MTKEHEFTMGVEDIDYLQSYFCLEMYTRNGESPSSIFFFLKNNKSHHLPPNISLIHGLLLFLFFLPVNKVIK